MNSMSKETKALMEEHIGEHGVPIMVYMYKLLVDNGCEVIPSTPESVKSIWDASLEISKGEDLKSKFFFHNTFVEILCVDRDDDPLIFDPEILGPEGFDYISDKTDEWTGAEVQEFVNSLNLKYISSKKKIKKVTLESSKEALEIMRDYGVGEKSSKMGFSK